MAFWGAMTTLRPAGAAQVRRCWIPVEERDEKATGLKSLWSLGTQQHMKASHEQVGDPTAAVI